MIMLRRNHMSEYIIIDYTIILHAKAKLLHVGIWHYIVTIK